MGGRRLDLRARVAVAATMVVLVAMAGAGITAWVIATGDLRLGLDTTIDSVSRSVTAPIERGIVKPPPAAPIDSDACRAVAKTVPSVTPTEGSFVLLVDVDGASCIIGGSAQRRSQLAGRVDRAVRFVSTISEGGGRETIEAPGGRMRVSVGSRTSGYSIVVARSATQVESLSRALGVVLAVVIGVATLIAALIVSRLVGVALRPLDALADDVSRVAATGDPTLRVSDPGTGDELAHLAADINDTLAALEASERARRRMISDSSHELRTPLTSLRTNLEVLQRAWPGWEAAERDRVIGDVIRQSEELSTAVEDLIRLARAQELGASDLDVVDLEDVLAECAVRFTRVHPRAQLLREGSGWPLRGDRALLQRAINNLLDNAVRWSSVDGVVQLRAGDSFIEVRDAGVGFPAEDLPHVFQRFYRASTSRSEPGSGLGLAIVARVAELHGGRAVAGNADDGGAVVRLELSTSDSQEPEGRLSAGAQADGRQ